MRIWKDYEWGYSPLWYKCAIMLLWMWGAQYFYHHLHTPYPVLPPAMLRGDMIEHHDHGWVVIKHARYTRYYYHYRCRVMETGKEVNFTNFDLTEDFNYVSGSDISRRLDSI